MINKDLLKSISEFDEKGENFDSQELVDNLDVMEKAHAKIHGLLITTRMRKLMRDFGQRESDIYVVSYPRSGTTLMQMVLYQMTTDGNMGFDHIYEVSPWSRFSAFFKRPMPSVGERRIIKTHDPYSMHEGNKTSKFIFLIRDCLDVIPSIYQQTQDYIDPSVNFEELSNRNMTNWLDYNSTWIENGNGLDILYLNYEDVVGNKREVISVLSKYLNVNIDEPSIERVLERTSIKFMKDHESKFGEQPDHWKVYNNFIRTGQVGKGRSQFTDEQLKEYRELSKKYRIEGTHLERYFA
ncbi:MAG: sulfotransferase domain-containing protein [Chryseolinea sp.]